MLPLMINELAEHYVSSEYNGFDNILVVSILNMEHIAKWGVDQLGYQLEKMREIQNLRESEYDHRIHGDGVGDGMNDEGIYPTPGNSNYT